MQVAESCQEFVLKIIEKSEWVDWDGVSMLYSKLAWIWTLPEKGEALPSITIVDEQSKSIWNQNNLILKAICDAFRMSQLSVTSKVKFLDCLLHLQVSPSVSSWVMEFSSSYMWTDLNAYLVYFDQLLACYFSKSNTVQTRMQAFSVFKEFYAARIYENLPLFPVITMKLISALPIEESEVVSEVVLAWLLKAIPNMADVQVNHVIDNVTIYDIAY